MNDAERDRLIAERDVSHYFNKGRCSGHAQFNGRYCRDVAGPEQWCINCAGFVLLTQLSALRQAHARLLQSVGTILRGFDEKVFVRNTDGDVDPEWAIRLFPFIQAIGVAQSVLSNPASTDSNPQSPDEKASGYYEIQRLRQRVEWLEGTAMPHARKQENANGFQKGWHAALARISEGDNANDPAALVPQPSADVDDTLPWSLPESPCFPAPSVAKRQG